MNTGAGGLGRGDSVASRHFRLVGLLLLMVRLAVQSRAATPQIDPAATLDAPWKMGDTVASQRVPEACGSSTLIRKFLGTTAEGGFLVQDFYLVAGDDKKPATELKFSDPYVILDESVAKRTNFFDLAGRGADGPYVSWYCDGKMRAKGPYVKGLQNGLWTQWYPGGQKSVEGTYKAGAPDGEWTQWFADGGKESSGVYVNGKPDGMWSGWYANGHLKSQGAYEAGVKNGNWNQWHENSRQAAQGAYTKGEVDGLWIRWHENGSKYSEGSYVKALPHGQWTEWYKNGQKFEEGK